MAYPDDRYLVGITPGSTFYWDLNGGTGKWSYYSGGAGGAPDPTATTNVILDSNTCSGAYTFLERNTANDFGVHCLDLIVNAPATGNVTFGFVGNRAIIKPHGNVSFYAGMIPAAGYGEFSMVADAPSTYTMNGVQLPWTFLITAADGSSVTANDDMFLTDAGGGSFIWQRGTFYGNGKNITAPGFLFNNVFNRTVVPGAATWTSTSGGWQVAPTSSAAVINITPPANPSDWIIKMQGAASGNVFLDTTAKTPHGTRSYGTLDFATTGTGGSELTCNLPIDTLKISGVAQTIREGRLYADGFTWHIKNFLCSGTAGNLNTITAYATTPFYLVKDGGGIVSNDYLNLSYCNASPANTWYAGTHSTDGGNNTGWLFTNPALTKSVGGSLSFNGTLVTNHKSLTGIARNAIGAALGNALVRLIGGAPLQQYAETTADANGNYTARTAYTGQVKVLVTKAGTPNVQGVSDDVTPT